MNCPVASAEYAHNSGEGDALHAAVLAHTLKNVQDFKAMYWPTILKNAKAAEAIIALCVEKGLAEEVAEIICEHDWEASEQAWRWDMEGEA